MPRKMTHRGSFSFLHLCGGGGRDDGHRGSSSSSSAPSASPAIGPAATTLAEGRPAPADPMNSALGAAHGERTTLTTAHSAAVTFLCLCFEPPLPSIRKKTESNSRWANREQCSEPLL